MWGEKDSWIPVINAYQFKDAISNSKLLIFDGAGHVPMEEIPEQSVREALSFLQQKPW
jgi:pimeloyl-ACP methyl ester carboxylesterase